MEFVELTSKEFDKVCNNFDLSSFYQSSKWAKIKEYTGWTNYYVGVKKDKKIIACSLILGKKIYLNKYMYYAPRGMLLDYNDNELLNFFTSEIKKYLVKKNGVIFKIDPLVMYKHHDKFGEVIDDEFSNQSVVDNLKKLGYKHRGFTVGYSDEVQFRWSYGLDIDKSLDELFPGMDQRCRRCIRKYEKYPLEVVSVNDKNMKDFKDIMEHTAKRQNHFDRTTEYYQNLDKEFDTESKLVIEKKKKKKFLDNFKEDKLYDLISKDNREMIPISAGVFIFDSVRANYVYGGTYREYMPLMAQYKMQIEMIKEAQKLGLKLYDFGGISGNFQPNTENYGVYEFKRGFGGYVIEYIGEFDLILNKFGYFMYTKGYALYRNFKHLIAKIIKR